MELRAVGIAPSASAFPTFLVSLSSKFSFSRGWPKEQNKVILNQKSSKKKISSVEGSLHHFFRSSQIPFFINSEQQETSTCLLGFPVRLLFRTRNNEVKACFHRLSRMLLFSFT
jgi:hypothetical protein